MTSLVQWVESDKAVWWVLADWWKGFVEKASFELGMNS